MLKKNRNFLKFTTTLLFVTCKFCKTDWAEWNYSLKNSEDFLDVIGPEVEEHIKDHHDLEFAKHLRDITEKQYGRS